MKAIALLLFSTIAGWSQVGPGVYRIGDTDGVSFACMDAGFLLYNQSEQRLQVYACSWTNPAQLFTLTAVSGGFKVCATSLGSAQTSYNCLSDTGKKGVAGSPAFGGKPGLSDVWQITSAAFSRAPNPTTLFEAFQMTNVATQNVMQFPNLANSSFVTTLPPVVPVATVPTVIPACLAYSWNMALWGSGACWQ